nr:MAG: ORF1 [Torque teno midi virus]
MPFWWRRRRKNWWGRWRRPRRTQRYKRRRRTYRRKSRYPLRRRRRRRRKRYKVRRKKQKLTIHQWQPDYIRRCRIKGLGALVIGAQGSQIDCYSIEKDKFVPPKVPWGGNSGIELFTLSYLYEEYIFTNNIWTTSNVMLDLCRYLRCTFYFYRHPFTDFVVSYTRQPPYRFNKYSIPSCHPQQLLLDKHKIIIPSTQTNPKGKTRKRVTIKPPKQMITRWFFTKDFSEKMLLLLKGAACNLNYSYLSSTNDNMLTSIYSINILFFQNPGWGTAQQPHGGPYLPYQSVPQPLSYIDKNGNTKTINVKTGSTAEQYGRSISYENGWFQPSFLQARGIPASATTLQATHPITTSRYNPNKDSGKGNKIWLCSTFQQNWKKESDPDFTIENVPLWLGLYGLFSYIKQMKTESYFKLHVVCLKSDAIYCYPEVGSCQVYCPIDLAYIQGKKPYDQSITDAQKRVWIPDMTWQKETLCSIVQSGPYVPQYSFQPISTWELKYGYNFYFKWGGATQPEKDIKDPKTLDTYDVPDTVQKTVQIKNPAKITPETIIQPWDYRRGFIKETALKRISDNISTDTEFQCSPEKIQKTERRGAAPRNPEEETQEINQCLQTLCKEDIFQEQETQDLQQLINQQHNQQQQIKHCMLQLLLDVKKNQKIIQYHTGLLD